LLGIAVYISIFVSIKRFGRQITDVEDKKIINSILIVWFMGTIFSTPLLDAGLYIIMPLFGYVSAKCELHRQYGLRQVRPAGGR
jgi:prolipoprotein diacylglyceryltransferase